MQYTTRYESPIGDILMAADTQGLTGLWLDGQKYYGSRLDPEHRADECSAFQSARKWLDLYFSGKDPGFTPPLHLVGTDFQKEVWELLLEIPFGETTTYGILAKKIAVKKGRSNMSPQAIGGAVSHNEISIIIPCHRVIGTDGSLTGYAGGLDKKIYLLELEGVNTARNRRTL